MTARGLGHSLAARSNVRTNPAAPVPQDVVGIGRASAKYTPRLGANVERATSWPILHVIPKINVLTDIVQIK